MARRTLAAAIILTAGALALTGCIPLPPAVPAAPTAPVEPGDPAQPTQSTEPGATTEPGTGGQVAGEEFTVDDGLGDVWTFSVVAVEADPPMEFAEPEPGTAFIGIVIDGEHLEGSLDFTGCFDIIVVGSDGEQYDWADTIGTATAEDDIFYADTQSFTGARAAVQLPEGVTPAQLIFRSTYGHPDVPDTVIDVQ